MQSLYELDETANDQPKRTMKKCPLCAELIQYEAVKCRFCNEFLDGQRPITSDAPSPPQKKIHQSNGALILALATVGPLALPLVWTNPCYSRVLKVTLSAVVLAVTVGLCAAVYHVGTNTLEQIKSLGL